MSGDDMPGKRKTPINWKEYNKELVNRGEKLANNLQTIRTDVVEFWDQELEDMNEGKMGRSFEYPNSQIVFFSVLKSAFNSLSYRNLEGFGHMFFEEVPNYTRINRRIKQLDIEVTKKINREITKARTKGRRRLEISMDGSGLQVNGKYVWTDRKHKKEKMRRRDWRKINIAIDIETKQILGVKVLGRNDNEGSHENTVDLLEDVFENISDDCEIVKGYGDGGYDNEDNFAMFEDLGIEPIIRIRKPSRKKAEQMSRSMKTRKRRKFFEKKRNKEGLKQFNWENYVEDSRYGKRSAVEGIIGSFKRFFRECLFSRIDDMIIREILTRVLIWNIMV